MAISIERKTARRQKEKPRPVSRAERLHLLYALVLFVLGAALLLYGFLEHYLNAFMLGVICVIIGLHQFFWTLFRDMFKESKPSKR